MMGVYSDIYEFAARAGAFEGYVYQRKGLTPDSLERWVDHLAEGYKAVIPEARSEFQNLCDGTIGRAIQSLILEIGEHHEVIKKLKSLMEGKLPSSPDDFSRKR
jgi:arsenate reductase-like glutaredoxin family protein